MAQKRHSTIEAWLLDGIRRGHLTQQQAGQLHGPLTAHVKRALRPPMQNRLALVHPQTPASRGDFGARLVAHGLALPRVPAPKTRPRQRA